MYGSARGLWGSSTGLLTQLPYLRAKYDFRKAANYAKFNMAKILALKIGGDAVSTGKRNNSFLYVMEPLIELNI
jgi:hypothetical protein